MVDPVRTADDVRLLTYEVARDLAAQQVRYAELTLTPYTMVRSGVPSEAFASAVEDALDHGPVALVGFGLGGPEVGVPRP